MKRAIVLDKSFLRGTSTTHVAQLAACHRLLMTDVLFHELLSNPEDRSICFAKFPAVENPVGLVMHVGGYLRSEISRRKPAPRPSRTAKRIRFQFNAQLRSKDYQLPPEAQEVLCSQQAELHAEVRSLIGRVELVPLQFPNVFKGSDSMRKAEREAAEALIATDKHALLEFYGQLRTPKGHRRLPPKRLLNDDWALYRWLQVHLLFALDLAIRYGNGLIEPLTPKLRERLEHDVLDAQYLIVGLLQGAFATDERKLRRWFSLLTPDGALYGRDG